MLHFSGNVLEWQLSYFWQLNGPTPKHPCEQLYGMCVCGVLRFGQGDCSTRAGCDRDTRSSQFNLAPLFWARAELSMGDSCPVWTQKPHFANNAQFLFISRFSTEWFWRGLGLKSSWLGFKFISGYQEAIEKIPEISSSCLCSMHRYMNILTIILLLLAFSNILVHGLVQAPVYSACSWLQSYFQIDLDFRN